MDPEEVRQKLAGYRFYHRIEVLPGIWTEPVQEFESIQAPVVRKLEAMDLTGLRVLDIGCRDGKFSFLAEMRGAAEVIGIDSDLSRGAVELLIPMLGSKVRMYELNVCDLTPETFGCFDLIIFAGVLYHLRYPFWGLKRIRDVMKPGAAMIMETAVYRAQKDPPMLCCPVDEESPYEPTSSSFFNYKGLVDTLSTFGIRTHSAEYLNLSPTVDRATLACTFDPSLIQREQAGYWDKTHRRHSDWDNRPDIYRRIPRSQYAPEEPDEGKGGDPFDPSMTVGIASGSRGWHFLKKLTIRLGISTSWIKRN